MPLHGLSGVKESEHHYGLLNPQVIINELVSGCKERQGYVISRTRLNETLSTWERISLEDGSIRLVRRIGSQGRLYEVTYTRTTSSAD